jgi:hypothetical protein
MGGFLEYQPSDEVLADDINEFVMRQVVGQFATSAVRNAAMSPYQGQCSTLDTDPGLLYVWDGTAWIPHAPVRATALHATPPTTAPGVDLGAPFIQAGQSVQVTNAGAGITIVFPEAFATPPPVILLTDRIASGAANYLFGVEESSVTATDFGGVVRTHNGDPVFSSTVRFSWLAIGQRP